MTAHRPFRFGLQVDDVSAAELRDVAVAAEAAGFDVVSTSDHVGAPWSPTLPLLAMAEATTRVRVCPMVINNDFHHPVHLAAEYANLDRLTAGRVELGIGAGHAFTEYAAIGQSFEQPAIRKARLAEAVEVIRRLLDGEVVTFHGAHYHLSDVSVARAHQQRLPILVGVNGRTALAHAVQHADIVGLTMLGRTLEDGQRHEVRWEANRLDATIDHLRDAAGVGRPLPQLNALVQRVTITEDREAAAGELCAAVPSLRPEDALVTPFVAIGTHAEIAEHLVECRRRWEISYFTVRSLEFAPVIDLLKR